MKNTILAMTFAMVSMGATAFANETHAQAQAPAKVTKEARQQARKDCKAEGKKRKDLNACIKAKLGA